MDLAANMFPDEDWGVEPKGLDGAVVVGVCWPVVDGLLSAPKMPLAPCADCGLLNLKRPTEDETPSEPPLPAGGGPAGVVDGLPQGKAGLLVEGVFVPDGAELDVLDANVPKRPPLWPVLAPPPKRLLVCIGALLAGAVVLLGVERFGVDVNV